MEQIIASVALPVGEALQIKKNVIQAGTGKKRLCVVTGTHGDELEGQYVCWKLAQILHNDLAYLDGAVEIYPALNPLGINTIVRGMPLCDLDMNRMFPGSTEGSMPEYVTALITQDLLGADVCIDIHASNIFLKEIPQVRISEEMANDLLPLAHMLGMDFIWLHSATTVLQSTLAHTLNTSGVKTLVVEMGVGMRITQVYGDRLVDGILSLMHRMGMWKQAVSPRSAAHHLLRRQRRVYQRERVRHLPAVRRAYAARAQGRTARHDCRSPQRRCEGRNSLAARRAAVYAARLSRGIRRLADRAHSGGQFMIKKTLFHIDNALPAAHLRGRILLWRRRALRLCNRPHAGQ